MDEERWDGPFVKQTTTILKTLGRGCGHGHEHGHGNQNYLVRLQLAQLKVSLCLPPLFVKFFLGCTSLAVD
jgi:hypothetical protein